MKKFDVLGRTYTHVRTDDLGEHILGLCDPNDRVIYTRASLEGEELLRTILHELDHAAKFESGLHQTMDLTAMEISAVSTERVLLDNFKLTPIQRRSKKRK